MNITVVTFAESGLENYCNVVYTCMEKNKSNLHNIRYVCMTRDKDFKLEDFEVVYRDTNLNGCNLHAFLIAESFKIIPEENDVVVVTDCDIGVFYKDWDNVLAEKSKEVDIFGIDRGSDKRHYENFPIVNFISVNRNFLEKAKLEDELFFAQHSPVSLEIYGCGVEISRRLSRHKRIIVDSDKLSKIFSVKKGTKLLPDTGWKLPLFCHFHNLKSQSLESSSVHDDFLEIKSHKRRKLAQWNYDDKMFVIHYTRSGRIIQTNNVLSFEPDVEEAWCNCCLKILRGN